MKILVTGGCGFVGSNLCIYLKKKIKSCEIYSLDNLFRKGSNFNKQRLEKIGIKNYSFNIKNLKKILKLPKVDFIIDCCAEPSIEVSKNDLDRVINTNLLGTFNVLKKCIKDNANIIFLSSSRVYPINELRKLVKNLNLKKNFLPKINIGENFKTNGVKSLYGFSKLSSEDLIKEINYSHKIKYIINRFGVISGPWQFGKQDQGFVSMWIAKHILKKNLSYVGFGGNGYQGRDVIHIDDVCEIIYIQIKKFRKINNELFNIGGGQKNYLSLKKLTFLCEKITLNKLRFKKIKATSNYDIPFFITNNSKIKKFYKWSPKKNILDILNDIFLWLKGNTKILNLYKNI